jgi:teichuronic acid biosynthesis glycosyltransferase TuaG
MNNNDLLVSVIMPAYNAAGTIEMSIQSVLRQTHLNLELLVVDDCSTDNTLSIARGFLISDHRIKVLTMKENSGPAESRNTAIEYALGRYIAFCDSDDTWNENKLQKQIQVLSTSKSAICFTSYYEMDQDGTVTDRIIKSRSLLNYEMMLRYNYIGCSTAIYDVDKCGKNFMPAIRKAEDYGLWLQILKNNNTAIGINDPLVNYRICRRSESSNKISAARGHWLAIRDVADVSLGYALLLFFQYAWIGISKSKI